MAAGRGVYGDRLAYYSLTDRCFMALRHCRKSYWVNFRADGDLRRDGVGNGLLHAD